MSVEDTNSNLEIMGFAEADEVLFKYKNQDVEQTFGISLKKYQGHIKHDREVNRMYFKNKTAEEVGDGTTGDGAYIFRPEWRNPMPKPYSKLVKDVIYQKGNIVE